MNTPAAENGRGWNNSQRSSNGRNMSKSIFYEEKICLYRSAVKEEVKGDLILVVWSLRASTKKKITCFDINAPHKEQTQRGTPSSPARCLLSRQLWGFFFSCTTGRRSQHKAPSRPPLCRLASGLSLQRSEAAAVQTG